MASLNLGASTLFAMERNQGREVILQSLEDLPSSVEHNPTPYVSVALASSLDDADQVWACLKHPAVQKTKHLSLSQICCFPPDRLVEALSWFEQLESLDLSHRGWIRLKSKNSSPF